MKTILNVTALFASLLFISSALAQAIKAPVGNTSGNVPAKAAVKTAPAATKAPPKKVAAKSKINTCKPNYKGLDPVKIKLSTSMGAITLELDKEKAPISTANFIKYVESGHYNGTIFHRVIENFMIQGGGFTKDMTQKPVNAPIKNEAENGLKNMNYTVAMARTGVVDSATSQFFINVKDNDFLNNAGPSNFGYAVFGKVVEGMDVVDKIKAVPVKNSGMFQNVPASVVTIDKAECL